MKKENKNQKHIPIIALILPVLVIIGIIIFVVMRFRSFVNPIELSNEVTDADYESYVDCLDMIVPLRDEDGNVVKQDIKKILILGSDSFAADRDSENGMAAMLAKETGAEVINCAITDSCITMDCKDENRVSYYPSDLFTPYRLIKMMLEPGIYDEILANSKTTLGDLYPSDADEVIDIINRTNLRDIDLVVIAYDFNDFYKNKDVVNHDNEHTINTYCGSILNTYDLIHDANPNARIIFMSPFYNYYVEKDGTITSGEIQRNSYGPMSDYISLSSYVLSAYSQASFVDNYFGTITEANYEPYLSDYKTLSQAGRELMIDRLLYAVNYFN